MRVEILLQLWNFASNELVRWLLKETFLVLKKNFFEVGCTDVIKDGPARGLLLPQRRRR